jgi:hypothetical protein
MRRSHILPFMLVTLAGIVPAAATGTLDCSVSDRTASIDVHGVVPYGPAAPLLQVRADVEATLTGISPDLGVVTFAGEHQVQFWLDDVSLNVLFYREREASLPFGSTTLIVKTSRTSEDEEGTYRGTYDLEGYEVQKDGGEGVVVHVQGTIECAAG